mmetsp:Transcript_19206/g.31430  ORF Transcript_19206/g.31430 Transcript_19206/m.31430 type:complete len:106 (-) Transcript_19206:60-377(-)
MCTTQFWKYKALSITPVIPCIRTCLPDPKGGHPKAQGGLICMSQKFHRTPLAQMYESKQILNQPVTPANPNPNLFTSPTSLLHTACFNVPTYRKVLNVCYLGSGL